MSWWGTSGLTNIASQATKALKNAQKQIDKVLDIDEGEGSGAKAPQSKQKEEETSQSSWSNDSWSSWSKPWDTGQETSDKEDSKSTSLLQDESFKTSPRETPKTLSHKSPLMKREKAEPSAKTLVSEEKITKKQEQQTKQEEKTEPKTESKEPENSSQVSSAQRNTIMTLNTESSDHVETDSTSQVEESKSSLHEKSFSDENNFKESSSFLTGLESSDRLSPISHGSGETTSTDSQSYEKVQSETSAIDVTSLHSINSGSESFVSDNLDNTKSKIADLVMEDSKLSDEPCDVIEKDSLQESLEQVASQGELDVVDNPEMDKTELQINTMDDSLSDPNFQSSNMDDSKLESNFPTSSVEELVSNILSVETVESGGEAKLVEAMADISQSQSDVIQNKDFEEDTDGVTSIKTELTQNTEDLCLESTSDDKSLAPEPSEIKDNIDNTTANISPVTSYIKTSSSESHDDQPSSPLTTSSSGEGSKLDSSIDTDDTVVDRKADSDSMDSVSPSSSYVKCMIEEAMDYNVKIEDNSSDGHSVGKSECSRSTGGHESGDEIDTTTSSDIEIISTPTSNGDGNKFIDLSPLKIALQKTARRSDGSHKRNDSHDSQSSSSSNRGEQLSPGRDTDSSEDGVEMKITSEEAKAPLCRELPPLDEEVADPYNTQKLLKKLAEMAEVLQAREDKLLILSKGNADLMETNSILRNQLKQVEESQAVQLEDVDQVTHEFTKRLSESEKLCQQAIREKEVIKKQYEDMQLEFQKRMTKMENALKEKEEITAELLQEGEKLSKQQLQSNTVIKKLRAKEKETDSLATGYRKKIDEQTTEINHLKTCLDSKEEMEKKQAEAINHLNTAVQKQERELSKLRGIETDTTERVRGLQTALDNSYKEIAELNKTKAALDSQAQAEALSQELQIKEELKATVEREQLQNRQERESLFMQIEDLRLSMQRMEKEHNRREDMLKQEISDLQFQLQEDEARNQDLSQSVTSATRPLLRQIENLQSTFAQQSASWEKVEKNLSDRLYEAQTQLASVTERERSASEKLMDINTQITSLESQNSHLRQDKSQLSAQQEILKSKIQVLEDAKHSESAQLEAFKQQTSHDMADLRKEKVFLETQLDMEKTKCEQEKKKFILAQDQITQMERDLQRPQSRSSTHSPVSISRQESLSSYSEPPNLMLNSFTQDGIDRNFLLGPQKTSLYDTLRQNGAANLLENLQSQLKLREGEIAQLQSDIQQLERTRESMARELVNLTNQNESLEEKIQELPELKEQFQDLNQRYNAILQMYGEKVEEADELRLDLNDVKEMYKMQIDHLLAK